MRHFMMAAVVAMLMLGSVTANPELCPRQFKNCRQMALALLHMSLFPITEAHVGLKADGQVDAGSVIDNTCQNHFVVKSCMERFEQHCNDQAMDIKVVRENIDNFRRQFQITERLCKDYYA